MGQRDRFESAAEREVAKAIDGSLGPGHRVWYNQRVTDDVRNSEVDAFLALPDAGLAVLEVKGGEVFHDGEAWYQRSQAGRVKRIRPVEQAREGMYALRRYVEGDPRWGSRRRVRWAHAVVFPFTDIPADFALPDCPRHMVFGRGDLQGLVGGIADIAVRQQVGSRVPTAEDVGVVGQIMRGRGLPQPDVVALAAERDAMGEYLTEQQGVLLRAAREIRRIEVRGGAGSGKTWLAIEQARQRRRAGERVALVCYSRGLAAYFRRVTSAWKRKDRPSYVGTFHGLGIERWGADPSPAGDDDSDYWEHRLPGQMLELAADLGNGHRFDTIVVDEGQDFADEWWPVVEAALKDRDRSRLTILTDEGQRVFARFGGSPQCQAVFVLEDNLRNTQEIAKSFQPLGLTRMRLRGGSGPTVRLVECSFDEVLHVADDEVEALLDRGWAPKDIVLLTTGSRHPEQFARQQEGQECYWASLWDDEQVFYGHVLGFKGLERPAVVLAVNESEPRERAKERLYVGLSRARDELVVCGAPDYLERVGGKALLRQLTGVR